MSKLHKYPPTGIFSSSNGRGTWVSKPKENNNDGKGTKKARRTSALSAKQDADAGMSDFFFERDKVYNGRGTDEQDAFSLSG
jgi:hypothetical protein